MTAKAGPTNCAKCAAYYRDHRQDLAAQIFGF